MAALARRCHAHATVACVGVLHTSLRPHTAAFHLNNGRAAKRACLLMHVPANIARFRSKPVYQTAIQQYAPIGDFSQTLYLLDGQSPRVIGPRQAFPG